MLERLSAAGRDVGVGPNGVPIGIAVDYGIVMATLAEGVPVAHGETVTELLRDGDRVSAVDDRGPGRRARVEADLVVACDGRLSAVRDMAGIEAEVSSARRRLPTFLSRSPRAAVRLPLHVRRRHDHHARLAAGLDRLAAHRAVGEEAAKAPGSTLPPQLRRAAARGRARSFRASRSWDQVRYVEPRLLRCPRWWVPGVVVIGDSAHTFGPDTGVGAGMACRTPTPWPRRSSRPDADTACETLRHLARTGGAPATRPWTPRGSGWGTSRPRTRRRRGLR